MEFDVSEKELELATEKFKKEMSKFPEDIQLGVSLGIEHLAFGCSWNFFTSLAQITQDENGKLIHPSAKEEEELFQQYSEVINKNKNMRFIRVNGGYFFFMDLNYLLGILSKIDTSGFLNNDVLSLAAKHRQRSLKQLSDYMDKGKSGKIGIFNLNTQPSITVNGIRYDSFCVTLPDLLAMCVKKGYKIKLGNAYRTPGQVQEKISQVLPKLEIAPSGNAMFIEIGR